MTKIKIKKGDKVTVIAGSNKGKTGIVLKVVTDKNRAVVEGVAIVKRHTKPNSANPQGGIVEKEAAVHISNLSLIDPTSGKPTRVGHRIEGDKKVRFAKKSGKTI